MQVCQPRSNRFQNAQPKIHGLIKQALISCLILVLAVLSACASSPIPAATAVPLKTVTLDDTVTIVTGQTVYVPVYSNVYMWDQKRTTNLTATLSLRNTDLTNPIIVASANYYDDGGKLIRKYLEKPIELSSLAATSFVVNQEDTSGGSGAAFVVEWVAQKQVSAPVIETVMINTSGNQGISFVSQGRVIQSRSNSQGQSSQ